MTDARADYACADTPLEELAEWLRLPVFPCLETKAPACPRGFKSAEREPAKIRALWRRYPGPLVGVPTGAASGFDALDVDVKNGARGMEWFEARRSELPETRIHRTTSGGLHILFRHLPGLGNSAGKIAPGVDVRADGGYIVWWPMARHRARGDLNNLAGWPTWLLPALTPPAPAPAPNRAASRPLLPAVEGLVRAVATAAPGQRNALTYWAAHRLKEIVAEGKISEGLAHEILLEAAARAGLPAREASLTINSAMQGGRG